MLLTRLLSALLLLLSLASTVTAQQQQRISIDSDEIVASSGKPTPTTTTKPTEITFDYRLDVQVDDGSVWYHAADLQIYYHSQQAKQGRITITKASTLTDTTTKVSLPSQHLIYRLSSTSTTTTQSPLFSSIHYCLPASNNYHLNIQLYSDTYGGLTSFSVLPSTTSKCSTSSKQQSNDLLTVLQKTEYTALPVQFGRSASRVQNLDMLKQGSVPSAAEAAAQSQPPPGVERRGVQGKMPGQWVVKQVKEEGVSKEIEVWEEEKSFLQKYWIYIVPGGAMMVMNALSAKQEQAAPARR